MGGGKFHGVNIYGVGTYPCGGFGGPPPRKFRNMKCSMSDSMTILALLRVTLCSESNIFFID